MPEPIPAPALEPPVTLTAVPDPAPPEEAWSRARRVAFRFGFCLCLLLYFPFPLGALPFTGPMTAATRQVRHNVGVWLAVRLLHPPDSELPAVTGSGDALFDYVHLAAALAIAALGAAAWSLLDRRRRQYRVLEAWLRFGLRWLLFVTMTRYGWSKVLPLQMTFDEGRLVEPFGAMSPMGLIWSTMGTLPAYQVFGGVTEVLGGVLLLWRRSATLGALVLLAALGQVVALNFFFDIPVKLWSGQLWLMAAYIAAPDARRIFQLLVLRRPVEPVPEAPLLRWERLRRLPWLGPALAIGLAGWCMYDRVSRLLEYQERLAKDRAAGPLSGAFQVESFTAPAGVSPKSPLSGPAWARVGGSAQDWSVLRADGSFFHVSAETTKEGTVKLTAPGQEEPAVVRADHPDPDHVRLAGDGGFSASLRKLPLSEFPLFRGFHWVQPLPIAE